MFAFTIGIIPLQSCKKVLVSLYIPPDAITNEHRKDVVNIMYALHKTNKAIPIMIQDTNNNVYSECIYAYNQEIILKVNKLAHVSDCIVSTSVQQKKANRSVHEIQKIVSKSTFPSGSHYPENISRTSSVNEEFLNTVLKKSLYYYKSIEPFHFKTPEEFRNSNFILKQWYSNGQLQIEIPIINGKKHGTQYTYSKNGKLESMIDYENGDLNGYTRTYHSTGFRDLDLHFLNNKKQGLCRKWNEDGSLELSAIFDEDIMIEEIPNYDSCGL